MRQQKKIMVCLLVLLLLGIPVRGEGSVPQAVTAARQSVFRVECEAEGKRFSGSAFLVHTSDQQACLATNFHVLDGANTGSLVVLGRDKQEYPALLLAKDADHDLCLIQTSPRIGQAAPLPLYGAAISAGEAVYALGFPGGGDVFTDDFAYTAEDVTLTEGIVSAVKQFTIDSQAQQPTTVYQTSAAINEGNSGGPLLNGHGQVVGINSFGAQESQGINASVDVFHLIALLERTAVPYLSGEAPRTGLPSWSWYVLAGVVLVAVATAAAFRLRRHRRKSLAMQLTDYHLAIPADRALLLLTPVCRQLTRLHRRKRCHLGIVPRNLYFTPSGQLALGKRNTARRWLPADKPYLPPEPRNLEPAGPRSDVYSLAAVLYRLVTGNEPVDALERLAGDALDFHNVPAPLAKVCTRALSLNPEDRFLDGVQLAEVLNIALEAPDHRLRLPRVATPRPRKPILRTVLLAGCAALVVAAFVLWGVNEYRYQKSLACIAAEDYAAARRYLSGVFFFYRDAQAQIDYSVACDILQSGDPQEARRRLEMLTDDPRAADMLIACDYREAELLLAAGQYDHAQTAFEKLGDYGNAPEMVLECDYRRAEALLAEKQYAPAKEIFLALEEYRDAPEMALECDYQWGLLLLEEQLYQQAKMVFSELAKENYKDSQAMQNETIYQFAQSQYERGGLVSAYNLLKGISSPPAAINLLTKVTEEIYQNGITEFKTGIGWLGNEWFEAIPEYKDVAEYIAADEASISYIIQHFNENEKFRLAVEHRDYLFEEFLIGSWQGGGQYFTLTREHSNYSFSVYSGKYYYLEDMIYYTGNSEDDRRASIQFTILDGNTILAYVYREGRSYTLTRQ